MVIGDDFHFFKKMIIFRVFFFFKRLLANFENMIQENSENVFHESLD